MDISQLQGGEVTGAQGVEGHERAEHGAGWVVAIDDGAEGFQVDRRGLTRFTFGAGDPERGIGKDDLAGFEDSKD
ncbi:hypothetical protein [Phytohabitans aurantiacus]|uniref:Uncharacterized protein n=1 Tax=Phytohabitans aurantiacus TaxID=3016789 RepID=A0ABQ5R9A5_9ACTN|nr:hypothetical protein [Phytohabitans aurantiacus]GLI03347.1 hypothetical protein Pa4123_86250 [Phytohabitans aurantiacus]